MNTGERIRKMRKAKGWTQAKLAEESNVAAISIHQYESGKRQPRTEQLTAIAKALGVSLESLITEETTITPGLVVKMLDHPDLDSYVYNIGFDTPEKLAFLFEHFKDQGVFQHLLISEFQKLNADGQSVAVQLMQQLAQRPEFQQHKDNEEVDHGLDKEKDS